MGSGSEFQIVGAAKDNELQPYNNNNDSDNDNDNNNLIIIIIIIFELKSSHELSLNYIIIIHYYY